MVPGRPKERGQPLDVERVLGRVRGDRPGPTLLGIGGIHGNEPSGVLALRRVLKRLSDLRSKLRGEFVALAGNRAALARGRRYVDRDLNRAWTAERLALLRERGSLDGQAEDREQVELLDAIEKVVERARGPVYVLDLHSTSGRGGAFSTFGDTLPNRDFATHIPVPMILGLEELVDGTLLGFLGHHGLVAMAFESGQHREAEAVDRAEAALWISLETAGVLRTDRVPEVVRGRKLLHRTGNGLPRVLEMRYRHDVAEGDGFEMEPGYRNFQPVAAGEVVAHDRSGPVSVYYRSRMLMPLYQEQGEDGFFLVREFHPFWLHASYLLRRLGADRVAHWLPGVRRDPEHADIVWVDKRVARWYAVQLFHLLGFRRKEHAGTKLVMARRRFDRAELVARGPEPEHLK